jgi:hypothetical protein
MTKHKRCAVSAGILLIMAVLVTGCAPEMPEQTGYQPPPGMGAVRLNMNFARSITPTTDLESFVSFTLTFTGTGGTTGNPTIDILKADRDNTFALSAGTYNLEVVGFLGAGYTQAAADTGTIPIPVTVATGLVTPITIILKPIVADGSGNFIWTINDTTSQIDSGTITITPLSGGTPEQVIPLTTTATEPGELGEPHTLTLLSGYYQVEIAVEQNTVDIAFQHILHIYKNQTSTFAYTLKDGMFSYTGGRGGSWTYEGNDKPPALTQVGTGALEENDTVTETYASLSGTPLQIQLTNPTDYDSVVWYCNNVPFATGITANTLTINGSTLPFDRARIYVLTVEGIKGGNSYTTLITLELQ